MNPPKNDNISENLRSGRQHGKSVLESVVRSHISILQPLVEKKKASKTKTRQRYYQKKIDKVNKKLSKIYDMEIKKNEYEQSNKKLEKQ